MNKSIILLVALCGGIACAIVYLNKQKTAPTTPTPVAEAPARQPAATPEPVSTPKPAIPAADAPAVPEMVPAQAIVSAGLEAKTASAVNSIHKTVDALLSAKSAGEKHALFEELVKSGHIDDAIAELKQRMVDNPTDAEIPTTLAGTIQLEKRGTVWRACGDETKTSS
ncbi:MAG: hypothetical protein P4N60_19050 [Verrucomicrobiae bacterium]|nr:hypothetical protein [Verrucomicrobiae bacterium]